MVAFFHKLAGAESGMFDCETLITTRKARNARPGGDEVTARQYAWARFTGLIGCDSH